MPASDTTTMAITLGSEVGLAMHLDSAPTYTDIETTLVDAGFTNYAIMRTQNSDGSSDLQLYVRNNDFSPMPAAETMQKVTAALSALEAVEQGDDNRVSTTKKK